MAWSGCVWLFRGMLGVALIVSTLTAAAQSGNFERRAPGVAVLQDGTKVLVAPMDVELFSISAGGVVEPKADWTQAAERHMKQSIVSRLNQSKLSAMEMPDDVAGKHAEALNLHAAAANAMALHHTGIAPLRLPTKEGKLDWSFGDTFLPLVQQTGARYALFTWVRDGYATAERKAMMVGAAILGAFTGIVLIPGGGQQTGYASLVDMQTGQVVWFNRLLRGSGDLREAEPAAETVDVLLQDFPLNKAP